jgi:protein TonB
MQADNANPSSPAGAPSALIKMAAAPHTIPGDTLPPTQLEEPPQPLVKAPPKTDTAAKTAVMQAVMPAPSATMSPAAVNNDASASKPVVSPPAPAVAQPVAASQPAATAPPASARKPAFTVQTEITRVQISGETLESYVIRKVPAVYPVLARQARIEGLVVLSIVVDEKGDVQDVKALSGPPLLARSAEDALRRWRFKPVIIDGKPTAIESKVSMNFQFPH